MTYLYDTLGRRRRISLEVAEKIKSDYSNGKVVDKIVSESKFSKTTVYRILNAENLLYRGSAESLNKRRYALNEKVFNALTPESEYWIGFLMADGYVSKRNTISVELQERDKGHIEKFKEFLGTNVPYRINTKTALKDKTIEFKYVQLTISSVILCEALTKYGVINKKSLTAEAALDLTSSRDFWRGIVDGDGCLGIYKPAQLGYVPKFSFSVCGSNKIIEQLCTYLQSLDVYAKIYKKDNTSIIHLSGNKQICRIVDALYTESVVSLSRKQNIADEMKTIYSTSRRAGHNRKKAIASN